jgi:hypothetical protein
MGISIYEWIANPEVSLFAKFFIVSQSLGFLYALIMVLILRPFFPSVFESHRQRYWIRTLNGDFWPVNRLFRRR